MKNLLLTYQSHPMINIGDYIQSLAARQFLLESPEWVERDYLNEYDGEEAKLIMNGWFTYRPENWPPSPKIHPLFVAMYSTLLVNAYILTAPNDISPYRFVNC